MGVISPIIALGNTIPIGPTMKSTSPTETRIAFSRSSTMCARINHSLRGHRVCSQSDHVSFRHAFLSRPLDDLRADPSTSPVYHRDCHAECASKGSVNGLCSFRKSSGRRIEYIERLCKIWRVSIVLQKLCRYPKRAVVPQPLTAALLVLE
jgi:hypothetical protein